MSFPLTKNKNLVILGFLKAPRIGYVKTRLARDIGPESALSVYRKLVDQQLSKIPSKYHTEIHYTPGDALEEMRNWLGNKHEFYPQHDGELGMRLEYAIVNVFKRGAKQVICIGGDCPKLDWIYFKQTITALKSDYDVVFGPSKDGGYYLVGLNAPFVQLFQNIPWSTAHTLEKSLSRSSEMNLRVKLLDTLYDIDEVSDFERATNEGLIKIKPDQK